jgi:hypothetical protein
MPSAFSMTLGVFPSITATQELVVPRSIPITFAIYNLSFRQTARARMTGTRLCAERKRRSPTILAWSPTQPAAFRDYIGGNPIARKEKRAY